jgi:peptidoglycan hydrolase-like protein with peptidoglycan-binding domain
MSITWQDVQRKVGVAVDGIPGSGTLAAIAKALGIGQAAPPPPMPSADPARLSANFTLAELLHSDTAISHGLPNVPDQAAVANLRRLAVKVLQPIRDKFGPVWITSGYRSSAVNAAVGGARNSQHTTGEAADFSVVGVSQEEVRQWIVANVPFDQLILYRSGRFHISHSATRTRRQVLRK